VRARFFPPSIDVPYTGMNHVPHTHESRPTYESVMSHTRISHITNMNFHLSPACLLTHVHALSPFCVCVSLSLVRLLPLFLWRTRSCWCSLARSPSLTRLPSFSLPFSLACSLARSLRVSTFCVSTFLCLFLSLLLSLSLNLCVTVPLCLFGCLALALSVCLSLCPFLLLSLQGVPFDQSFPM